jgi:hypothetical protein
VTTPAGQPTVKCRAVLWPAVGDGPFDSGDLSLTDANPIELEAFARDYAGVPLLELMRRLRLAEWNAAEYQRQAEAAQRSLRGLPPLHAIQELDARHKRIRGLLAAPGRISKADLEAALREPATP